MRNSSAGIGEDCLSDAPGHRAEAPAGEEREMIFNLLRRGPDRGELVERAEGFRQALFQGVDGLGGGRRADAVARAAPRAVPGPVPPPRPFEAEDAGKTRSVARQRV